MPTPKYIDLYGISKLQTKVMRIVDVWVREEKTPIPRTEIMKAMLEQGTKEPATKDALRSLINYGYLRRAVIISNKTYYVQLRRVA